MKHKVKEIFDNREEYRRWQDDVQELFDCQLIVEEIETIERYIKCAIEYKEYLASDEKYLFKNSTKREIVKMKQMISKLHKQKEMWLND